jgi:hypothetical protein
MTSSAKARVPLWRRILGGDFDRLPPAVQQMFDHNGHRYARGMSDVVCGESVLARLCIVLSGFPKPGTGIPAAILFQADGDDDVWHRSFGTRSFASVHSERNGLLLERFGALTFVFRLSGDGSGVTFTMVETQLFGVALPRWLSPSITATQSERNGRFSFEIIVDLPFVGRMVRMTGLLSSSWMASAQTTKQLRPVRAPSRATAAMPI